MLYGQGLFIFEDPFKIIRERGGNFVKDTEAGLINLKFF
jgi:hypothetical protein